MISSVSVHLLYYCRRGWFTAVKGRLLLFHPPSPTWSIQRGYRVSASAVFLVVSCPRCGRRRLSISAATYPYL